MAVHPHAILARIRHGWVAALFSAGVALAAAFTGVYGAGAPPAWGVCEAAGMLGLAWGIYRKSRACAVLMLVYCLASRAFLIAQGGHNPGAFMSLLFAYFFWEGVVGTFAYHRFMRQTSGG